MVWILVLAGLGIPMTATGAPVRVVVDSIAAVDAGGVVFVRWTTTVESGVLGFDLHRWDSGQWIRINEQLMVAENTIEGGRYQVEDSGASAPGNLRYRLSAVADSGGVVELLDRELGLVTEVNVVAPETQASGPRISRSAAPTVTVSPFGRLRTAAISGPVDLITTPSAVKILTTGSGIHFVSAGSLAAVLGQSQATVEGWINSGRLGLSNTTNAVGFVRGNGWIAANQTGPGLFFYAGAIRDNYTTTNAYWLRAGTNSFLTESGGNPVPQNPGVYFATQAAEVDGLEARSTVQDPEDDFWFWTRLTANSASSSWSPRPQWTLDSSLVRDPAVNATLKLRLYGASRTAHLVEVSLLDASGQTRFSGTQRFSGIGAFEILMPFPSDRLGVGVNQLGVRALLDTGVSVSQFYVDGYELSYPRTYATVGTTASLEAGSEGGRTPSGGGAPVITVSGFGTNASPPALMVLEITNPLRPKVVSNVRVDNSGTWRASFSPPGPGRRYALLQPLIRASQKYPVGMSLVTPTALAAPTNRAGYLIVTHPSLTSSADQLAAYRGTQFRTRVVQMEDIYNEFSYGIHTPHALSRFLRVASTVWATKPRYLVLLGDGTYDYRNLQAAGDNLVPPLMVKTLFGLTASDSLYGDVFKTGEYRLIVGRLPARTTAEASEMIGKIQRYEASGIRSPLKALLVADQSDGAGDFIANLQAVQRYLSPAYVSTMVHPGYKPATINQADLTNRIRLALDGGVDLMNYIGHGALDRFGATSYLWITQPPVTPSVVLNPPLANGSRLPVLLAMTCSAGTYSSPGYVCLGEGMLRAANAGAVGVIAATGLSQDLDAEAINQMLMESLSCNTRGRLGDLIAQSYTIYNSQVPPPITPVWIYNLLGDPALRLVSSIAPTP